VYSNPVTPLPSRSAARPKPAIAHAGNVPPAGGVVAATGATGRCLCFFCSPVVVPVEVVGAVASGAVACAVVVGAVVVAGFGFGFAFGLGTGAVAGGGGGGGGGAVVTAVLTDTAVVTGTLVLVGSVVVSTVVVSRGTAADGERAASANPKAPSTRLDDT
jgi:hypothetical protein